MEYFLQLDNNNLVGIWMLLGFVFALLMTVIGSYNRKLIQFFYTYPYSIGIYLILGPFFIIFIIKQWIGTQKSYEL